MNVYLGPSSIRWNPTSESDLAEALTNGLIEESHYLDFKASIGTSSGANRELARDLAQFAIDAGTLIVGVAEVAEKFVLAPVALDGLPERVEQVARTLIDPPLALRCQVLQSLADPTLGYLLVQVPAFAQAPHMVDGIYYGRGDKTRTRLSNAEVVRLHDALRVNVEDGERHLDAIVARDPVPEDVRRQAHFFAFATPVTPRREMALALVHGADWMQRFRGVIEAAHDFEPFHKQRFAPDLGSVTQPARRVDGAAMSSDGLTPDRIVDPERSYGDPEDIIEVEISEDGEVRLYTGRLSDALSSAGAQQVIFDEMPVVLTRQLVMMAGHVGRETGYRGQWLVGVAAVGIEGLQAYDDRSMFRSFAQAYPSGAGDYRSVLVATAEEVDQTPGRLTERLVGRLLRALGRSDRYYAALVADEADES